MATFVSDFSEHAVGENPTGWLKMWGGTRLVIVAGPDYTGGKALVRQKLASTTATRDAVAWTTPGIPSAANGSIELRIRWRVDVLRGNDFRTMMRIDPASTVGAETAFFYDHISSTSIDDRYVMLRRYSAGALTSAPRFELQHNAQEWMQTRMLLVPGDNVYAKVWVDGTTEPAAWDTSMAENTITTDGYVGFGGYTGNVNQEVDYITLGTAGEAAPLIPARPSAVKFHPDPPTNLQAVVSGSDITLTWNSVLGVDGYRVFRGSKVIGTSTSTTFTDINPPQGAHHYTVRAYKNKAV